MPATDELIPISALFFDDAGPHVVQAPGAAPSAGEYTPARGTELRALLDTSITQLGAVSGGIRRRTPGALPPVVPVESLLYRGEAALARALELRENLIAADAGAGDETLTELLDLIALAATE